MSSEPERERRGLLLVISSPSGAGKSSLARRLVTNHPGLALSVSATTRSPRPGEADGREYRFLTRGAFDEMAAVGDFLEWAEVHEHRYGTPRTPVMAALARGQDMLFDIDWQGAEMIAQNAPDDTVRVFVLPPNMAELAARLHARAQDAEDVIARRLGRAKGEIEKWATYDYVIINDDFDRAYAEIDAVYRAERSRAGRNGWLRPFVASLLNQPV